MCIAKKNAHLRRTNTRPQVPFYQLNSNFCYQVGLGANFTVWKIFSLYSVYIIKTSKKSLVFFEFQDLGKGRGPCTLLSWVLCPFCVVGGMQVRSVSRDHLWRISIWLRSKWFCLPFVATLSYKAQRAFQTTGTLRPCRIQDLRYGIHIPWNWIEGDSIKHECEMTTL